MIGGWQSDFARHLSRDGGTLVDLTREAVEGCLGDAELDVSRVGVVHVGNAFGELFASQAQLGAMPATAVEGLWGVPATRHEAACASGSAAVLAAMADLESGRYDCALVLGVEQERNVPGEVAGQHLGTAALQGRDAQGARYPWPAMFSQVAEAYESRGGLVARHLRKIAQKNLANGRRNPLAQTRRWSYSPDAFDDAQNPLVEGRIRRHDCAQVTDGAAAVILASSRFARELDRAGAPRIAGWGHTTAGLSLDDKLRRAAPDGLMFPHVRRAFDDACRRAKISGARDLDAIELHDCFTVTEYALLDHLGLAAPGALGALIDRDEFAFDGPLPVNPSGGLIGGGHPVGATGVRMVVDAAKQLTGRAGHTQVKGARRVATLNIGGSFTTVISFILATETA